MLDELLDPLKGIERGLMETDNDSLLINIRVGEVRKIARCLRIANRELVGEHD
jgi:hypothetical protein